MSLIIFRPVQLPKSGFLYGWNISNDTICIAGALATSSREQAVNLFAQVLSNYVTTFEDQGEIQPEILGSIEERKEVVLDRGLPSDGSWIFVEYSPPNTKRMQFLSLEPLDLDITRQPSNPDSTTLVKRTRLLQKCSMSGRLREEPHSSLHLSLRYLNKVHELRRIVAARQNDNRLSFNKFDQNVNSLIERFTNLVSAFCHLLKTTTHLHSLLFRFRFLWSRRLRDTSAFVQQLDVRKNLLLFVLKQTWRSERLDKDDLHFTSVQYISLYNSIWLILNDVIVGTAFGIFLIENSEALGHLLYKTIDEVFVICTKNVLVWLDNWPAGLKLNTELSRALFHCCMQIVHLFEVILEQIAPYFTSLLRFTGGMGRFGLTMTLALFSDYLSVLTGHVYMLHLVTTSMFSLFKSFSGSLWNLFRGKRFNVLRRRNDFWEYDLDQLLLGTILITLIAFLFPTVALYYLLFALVRFGIMIIYAGLDICLAFMNHFPIFALMLRIKEPFRLPGGVQFKIGRTSDSLVMQNQPIPLSRIFFQHLVIWSKLSSHYHPLRLLVCIAKGIPMSQLSRQNIRYDLVNVNRKANKNLQ